MSDTVPRFERVLAAIDSVNARDPRSVDEDGLAVPAELLYGRRMSAVLAAMAPDASELLRIAVRGQHVERWTSPRTSYPPGRSGYLKWRSDLKDYHARRLHEIVTASGYSAEEAARVGALVRKERLRTDPDAQTLEDVACIVFLAYYLDDFLGKTDADDAKLARILAKTWNKMSPRGHAEAGKLGLPAHVAALLKRGLEEMGRAEPKPL